MTSTDAIQDAPASSPLPPYRLAALLEGHTSDVRSLCTAPLSSSRQLLSTSRDGSTRLWTQMDAGKWTQEREWREGHEGFVNAVCFVPAVEGEEDQSGESCPAFLPDFETSHLFKTGYVATAGADALIQLYALGSPSSSPVQTLLGHAHNVCALHSSRDGQTLVSASWDGTARVWKRRRGAAETDEGEWSCERVLADHGAAVWDIQMVEDGRGDSVLTGERVRPLGLGTTLNL